MCSPHCMSTFAVATTNSGFCNEIRNATLFLVLTKDLWELHAGVLEV